MGLRTFVFVLFLCYLVLADGNKARELEKLSREEELNLEKELKLLNKPAVKTIKTEYGDLYDCVDFYNQPAFDHPLLKNHTFHPKMRPASRPKWAGERESRDLGIEPSSIGLKGGGCPEGTVLIRRTTKEDLIQSKLFAKKLTTTSNDGRPGTHHAVVRSKPDPNAKFHGIEGMLTTWNLPVKPDQFTSGQMTIQNGPDSIQLGWTVNPSAYGDSQTRLFTFWTAGQTRCLNSHCPGFVLVNTETPLDNVLNVSTRGGVTYGLYLLVYRDVTTGVWWLELTLNNTILGFWPPKIFSSNGLAGPATYVEWGGKLYSPPGEPGPGMGSGHLPQKEESDTTYDAIAFDIGVANEHDVFTMPTPDLLEIFVDNYDYYDATNMGNTHSTSFNYLMFYGGIPGITSP